MTKEEALDVYWDVRYKMSNSKQKKAVDMAFDALREQEEKPLQHLTPLELFKLKSDPKNYREMTDEQFARNRADCHECPPELNPGTSLPKGFIEVTVCKRHPDCCRCWLDWLKESRKDGDA